MVQGTVGTIFMIVLLLLVQSRVVLSVRTILKCYCCLCRVGVGNIDYHGNQIRYRLGECRTLWGERERVHAGAEFAWNSCMTLC